MEGSVGREGLWRAVQWVPEGGRLYTSVHGSGGQWRVVMVEEGSG